MPDTCRNFIPLYPITGNQTYLSLMLTYNLSVAIGAAIYSSGKKLMTDKTLRLYRNSPESREH